MLTFLAIYLIGLAISASVYRLIVSRRRKLPGAAVYNVPRVFAVMASLRNYAARHNVPTHRLHEACRIAVRELGNGRSEAVAMWAGERAMRASQYHHQPEGTAA